MNLPSFIIRASLTLALATITQASAQLTIRNAVSDSEGNPRYLLDGLPTTGWTSTEAGASAAFLLEEGVTLEAEVVFAKTIEGQPVYQFQSSMNYRDWMIAGQGDALTEGTTGDISPVDSIPARYLRFVSLADTPVTWELMAGSLSDVQNQLELFQPVDWGDITNSSTITEMLKLAFDWQMEGLTTRQDAIGWVNGAFYSGVSGLYAYTGDTDYRAAIVDIGNSVDWTLRERTSGKRFYHADDHCIGQSWLELYMLEPDPQERWITDVRGRIDRVMATPLPGREDMNWCDALYMSPPVYTRLYEITGDEDYLTFIDGQWWDVTDHLYDPAYKLFYRDSNYFDDREPNGEPVFWSRGNGWVIGGLVRLMQHLPEDWPSMGDYENLLREMAGALAAIQGGEDGLWSSSLLYPEKYDGERETSGSAFFTYGIAWGVNEGILDAAVYGPVIERAWEGLTTMLTRSGSLNFIQQIGAGPARNDGKLRQKDYGYGAFLLAGVEMMRYFESLDQPARQAYWASVESPVVNVTGDPGSWSVVDDFENGFGWNVRKNVPFEESLVNDPFDTGGSQVFSIYTGNFTEGEYRATTPIPAISEGSLATVYQRFSYDSPEVDVLLGISDFPVVDSYSDYENGLRVYYQYNQLEARSGGAYTAIGDDLLQLETWYEAWTIINNGTDTYDVYLKGGSNYPELTLLATGIPFRNGTTTDIISYAISYNTDWCDGTFYLDDLYIDVSGANLTRPSAVRQPLYSPWSSVGRNPATLAKSTPTGNLWDETFPWIYHWELGGWCHVYPAERYAGGYWLWSLESTGWIWLSTTWPGWAFDARENTWFLLM